MAPGLMHHGLEVAASRFPDHPALLAGHDAWTYRELDAAADALASKLGALGVGHGDRVAVMTANRPEFVVAVNAISKLGASAVLLSPAWKALEVDSALSLTAPGAAVADGAAVELLSHRLGTGAVLDVDEPAVERGIGREARRDRPPT